LKLLTFVEIDIDYCSLTYGAAPCTASIPTTGAIKCFNSLKTCQDQENFANSPATLRFAEATDYLPKTIRAIPSISSVSFRPSIVSLGQDLGQRASVTVKFKDHPHSDTGEGFDKYLADRPYDPFKRGTFWGKFRARQPYLTGRPMRLIRGVLGQALEDMDVRHYIIESFDGPTTDGSFTITAKDVLKLADEDRAQAPRPSNGFLAAGINSSTTSATLSPTGIGNAEYPASGFVNIGGKEVCAFTRSGNTLTLTRAQKNTTAAAHDANERVQLCLVYSAQTPAEIIEDLLVNYAEVDGDYIDSTAWADEVDSYLDLVYTTTIAEPTPVEKLCSELIEQAALALWWDDVAQQLRLRVIRAVPAAAEVFTRDNVCEGSLTSNEQPDRRISSVLTFFGMRSPLEGVDDTSNYLSSALTTNTDAIAEYGSDKIKIIYSRWIPFGGLTVAERLNGFQLGRFRDPPRRFNLDVFKYGNLTPILGAGYQLSANNLQDATGAQEIVPIQVTSLNPGADLYEVEAEEMRFDDTFLGENDVNNRVITIDVNATNVNLRTLHDTLYPAPTESDAATVTVTCIIQSGVIVSASSATAKAFDVGSWPAGWDQDNLIIINNGSIRGAGGKGGNRVSGYTNVGLAGQKGGTAFYTRENVTLDNNGSILAGGGGGGSGGGATWGYGFPSNQRDELSSGAGGGGAGIAGGPGGSPNGATGGSASGASGRNGETRENSYGGDGGDGGDVGQAGHAGESGRSQAHGPFPAVNTSGAAGGAAGNAVDGNSFITYQSTGTRTGLIVN